MPEFPFLTIWDLILTPIFLLVLTTIAKNHRNKRYPTGHPLREFYMKGLFAKFGGCIFIALIYAYYYKIGDTYYYYVYANRINSALNDSFSIWWDLMLHRSIEENPNLYPYISEIPIYRDASSYTVARLTALMGLTNGTTYLPTALLFAYFSYTGSWAMYKVFANAYPLLLKQLAVAFLFIPSVVVWGSAIFKDTVCMFGLGWLTYTTFRLFVNRDLSFKNIFFVIITFWMVASVKVYILLGFVPALMLWLLMSYSRKIRVAAIRWFINIAFLALTVFAFSYFTAKFAMELDKYSLKNISKTSQLTREWIAFASTFDQGSSYDLGEFASTPAGMLSKFPQAVVVTLFRPFPWEARKVIVFLSAMEALIFLYFTLKIIFIRNSFKSFKLVFRDPNVLFCLIFSLIFAFAVGISSYNFGALSRYKIPCLPFYAAFLMIVIHYHRTLDERLAEKQRLEALDKENRKPATL